MLEDFVISQELGHEDLSIHSEISLLRTSEDPYDKDIWQKKEVKTNWEKIITLAKGGLMKSRDLTLAMRLTEALVYSFGISGLKKGILVIKEVLQGDFFPKDEDYQDRLYQWFDQKLPLLAFYDNMINYVKTTAQASLDLSAELQEILTTIKTFQFPTDNFQRLVETILIKIEKKPTEAPKTNETPQVNNEEKLTNLIKELNNLMPKEKERIQEILLGKNSK